MEQEEVGSGSSSEAEEVLQLEDAVGLLVEHLVDPVLPLGQVVDREDALSPETQEAVARQVHAVVLLYNYYHRKQFPQLQFASPDQFSKSASLTVTNKNLLMYLNGVGEAGLSVTDKAIIDACDIAEALDATKDSPDMMMWPISKVAVLLINQTKNVCLLEHGSQTKGVWSMLEKDIETAFDASLNNERPVQGLSNKPIPLPSVPYMLQQIAYSEVELKTGVQMDKNITDNNSRNVPQDIILGPDIDPVTNNHALKIQKEKVIQKSGGITSNMNVQIYVTLQLLQKMRDDTLHEHLELGDRSAEYEMDIQTILTETEMTPKVTSIIKKYENSWKMMEVDNPISSEEGCKTMDIKRKKLKEAILLRNKCQQLGDICRESNWILPRYKVLPSVTGDMYQANVHLMGPDFNMSVNGDMRVTPHEARDSAASNMLCQLQQKAMED
ncbi:uncharacterized protein LOC8066334 [Sorghum bicolor]|uniref:uncharacterized protein LOC8066334 n=1 Tax=Sorghum bicolor TaxID=4558 RepID=UPI000B424F49|nr:uncharacterized protein LOC8066334 [Sorghum bicolor]|eukprot:XP_021321766.1 uncharacterized protein LOC8066334 [Sorghum bicolor]